MYHLEAFLVVVLGCLALGQVNHVTITDCMKDPTVETMSLAELTFTPYPPELPGNITVSAAIQLRKPLQGHVGVQLLIHRKMGFLGYALRIPCVKNVGSCNYTDVCAMVSRLTDRNDTNDNDTAGATQSALNTGSSVFTDLTTESSAATYQATSSEPSVATDAATSASASIPEHTHPSQHITLSTGPEVPLSSSPSHRTHTPHPHDVTTIDTFFDTTTDGPVVVDQGPPANDLPDAASSADAPTMFTDDVPMSTESIVTDTNEFSSTMMTDGAFSSTDGPATGTTDFMTTEEAPATYASGEDGECPDVLAQYGLPCKCPFEAGVYRLPPTLFEIPDLGSFSALAKGDYRVIAHFFDTDTGEMVACQQVELSLTTHAPCTGLACILG